ncbi:sulfate reduction electron transfer complex DsrMKJOP subunit DsrM [Desulfococcus sp.]|uniref:sulfate reduction electron transfer complex DsrMKJOP subunit DsrM n=1 Tax=Desulfococcus sp. TaxID=2025834 RepID=UPI003593792A
MNVKYMFSLLAVVLLFLLAYAGVEAAGLQVFFGIVIPYLAFAIFLLGFIRKVVDWAGSPVPFRITTTCGQQQSLPWINQAKFDNPSTPGGVIIRMILEILTFRSLFRNVKFKYKEGGKLFYGLELFLWLGALAFHYTFLVVCIRHLRFLTEPVPFFVKILEQVDGFFQFGLPVVYLSGIVLLAATLYLLARRMFIPQVNYISLAADYFPLFLIIGIAATGIMMRYFTKVDVTAVKEFTMGLVTFHPVIPKDVGGIFYVHLLFVSVLLMYFPFSKLMHLGGIFMSPTRNLTGNTRAVRHVNPWNYPVKVHTYEEYEDHFRDLMIEAGLPVENKE